MTANIYLIRVDKWKHANHGIRWWWWWWWWTNVL